MSQVAVVGLAAVPSSFVQPTFGLWARVSLSTQLSEAQMLMIIGFY